MIPNQNPSRPTRRLRIAVWYNLPPGGARRSLYYQVKGLLARGHEVSVWRPTPEGPDSDLMSLGSLIDERHVPLKVGSMSGTVLDRIDKRGAELRASVEAMTCHSQLCATEMEAWKADVLLATNCVQYHAPFVGRFFAGPKALYLQEPKRILYEAQDRSIWRHQEVPAGAGRLRSLKSWIGDRFRFRMYRELANLDYHNAIAFDLMLVNSYFSRESMLRAYNIDAKVCYLGIDPDLFRLTDSPKKQFVVGLGSITPNKNIEFVIDSLATIAHHRPKLVWIGQTSQHTYAEVLAQRAHAKGVELELRVMASDPELIDALGGALALVYAPRLEPFGFAPLEANACGTVAIGVREGGVRETIVDGVNGFLVPPDHEAFGAKVAELAANPALARQMGREAASHVRSNWTWDRSIDLLETELYDLVGRVV